MNSTLPLTGAHRRTYDTIFGHPLAQNLQWRDVHALLESIGNVVQEPNGHLKVTRNGQTTVLHSPRTKDFSDADELMDLRRFLERSEIAPASPGEENAHWLLVIDHHEARIFRSEMHGASPQRLLPAALEEYFRHAKHSLEVSRGKEKPDPNSFFEPVAKALQAAGQILIFGTGTGTSSEMEQFIAWSKKHHPELARRFVGSLTIRRAPSHRRPAAGEGAGVLRERAGGFRIKLMRMTRSDTVRRTRRSNSRRKVMLAKISERPASGRSFNPLLG